MEILIGLVIIICILFAIIKVKKNKREISLLEIVKKVFPKNKIIEKFGTVMICEINHRNEPDELAFIRINKNRKKSIKKEGRRLVIEYQGVPTRKELKNDLKEIVK